MIIDEGGNFIFIGVEEFLFVFYLVLNIIMMCVVLVVVEISLGMVRQLNDLIIWEFDFGFVVICILDSIQFCSFLLDYFLNYSDFVDCICDCDIKWVYVFVCFQEVMGYLVMVVIDLVVGLIIGGVVIGNQI